MPADNLGFGGFQVSGELALTRISRDRSYWNAAEGVVRENPAVGRPPEWLSTAGAFVRKGLWLGLPAFEVGAGVMNLLESNLLSWQGYGKLALHEGFHSKPFPSLAVRGSVGYLTGTDQARMTVSSFDVVVSKRFGVMGTFRIEPYIGWSFMRIVAQSLLVDATPSCDAYKVRTGAPGTQPLGEFCADAQRGTANDELANFRFPKQSPIRRQRVIGRGQAEVRDRVRQRRIRRVPGGQQPRRHEGQRCARQQRHAAELRPQRRLRLLKRKARNPRPTGAAVRRLSGASNREAAYCAGRPLRMIFRRPSMDRRGPRFSSSKMIWAIVAAVRSCWVVLSTTRISSPLRINPAIC